MYLRDKHICLPDLQQRLLWYQLREITDQCASLAFCIETTRIVLKKKNISRAFYLTTVYIDSIHLMLKMLTFHEFHLSNAIASYCTFSFDHCVVCSSSICSILITPLVSANSSFASIPFRLIWITFTTINSKIGSWQSIKSHIQMC